MKIEYGSDTLGDDSTGDLITPAVARSHARLVHTEDLAGGANPVSFARRNARNQISFAVEKEHADLAAAVAFVFSHPDGLADQATLRFSEGATAYELADACLQGCELLHLTGRSTGFRYSFIGGAITEAL